MCRQETCSFWKLKVLQPVHQFFVSVCTNPVTVKLWWCAETDNKTSQWNHREKLQLFWVSSAELRGFLYMMDVLASLSLLNVLWREKKHLLTYVVFIQGPQGPQGVQGERGPTGEGLPGPKVSVSMFNTSTVWTLFSTDPQTCSDIPSGLQVVTGSWHSVTSQMLHESCWTCALVLCYLMMLRSTWPRQRRRGHLSSELKTQRLDGCEVSLCHLYECLIN